LKQGNILQFPTERAQAIPAVQQTRNVTPSRIRRAMDYIRLLTKDTSSSSREPQTGKILDFDFDNRPKLPSPKRLA